MSLDGKKTELLYTIANRSADFFVTDNSLLVLDGGALKKIDLNKKSLNKINNKKNYVEVRSNVSSLQPIVANGAFSGMALMVSNAADSDSWKKSTPFRSFMRTARLRTSSPTTLSAAMRTAIFTTRPCP